MPINILEHVSNFKKDEKIKKEIDEVHKRINEFLKKYPYREHPEKIDFLKEDDIYNPGSDKEYFLYWIEHNLKKVAAIGAYKDGYAREARGNIEKFKNLLKIVVDDSKSISEKIDADWESIKYWGEDKNIAKKIIFCYYSDKIIPILRTDKIENFAEKLGLDYSNSSNKKFGKRYEDLKVGEKFELLNDILLDFKNNTEEIKDFDTITFAKFLEYVFPDVNERKKNNEKTINKNKENQEHTNMYNYKKIIENHKQMIFYGPPGTGKTREAKRIAYQLIFDKKFSDNEELEDFLENEEIKKQFEAQCKIVVFHPSYEYDDFMVGIKPVIEGEKLNFKEKHGIFYELYEEAKKEENKEKKFVLIIDEINRGNLPKILGELVYALEYRKSTIKLPVTGEDFKIPENVYIIGTMNSADRSIGHIDVAIRRRFALVYMGPNEKVVEKEWAKIDKGKNNYEQYGKKLAEFMTKLNEELQKMAKNSGIVVDEREIGIGHSYFLPKKDNKGNYIKDETQQKEFLKQKWEYFIKPLLREYAVQFGIGDLKDILECEDIDSARQKIKPEKEKNEPANSGDQSKPAKQ